MPGDALPLATFELERVLETTSAMHDLAAPLAQWVPRLIGLSHAGCWRVHTPFSTSAMTVQPTEQCVQTFFRTSTAAPALEPLASAARTESSRTMLIIASVPAKTGTAKKRAAVKCAYGGGCREDARLGTPNLLLSASDQHGLRSLRLRLRLSPLVAIGPVVERFHVFGFAVARACFLAAGVIGLGHGSGRAATGVTVAADAPPSARRKCRRL